MIEYELQQARHAELLHEAAHQRQVREARRQAREAGRETTPNQAEPQRHRFTRAA
ncbi:hypothetical protein ABT160_43900 [Streptomyces sp. NPDC001941]|uniref:hypothetical protein n=1 Tax=Streptomyces sp. NPDC001941 TaxID=3154659 RepID=UPI003329B244